MVTGRALPQDTIPDGEWAKIVDAAKKEGNVTCYCWMVALPGAGPWAAAEFKAAYGIEVEMMGFSGTISVERIKTEARAGKYVADVEEAMATYHVGSLEGTGLLKRIDNLPAVREVGESSVWRWSPLLTANTFELPWEATYPAGNYSYNTNLVSPERLPKTRQDLLDPYWKGKLCEIDPITYAGIDYALWGWFRESGYADWYPEFFYNYFYKSERHVLGILGGPNKLNAGDCAMSPSWVGTVGVGGTKRTHIVDKATWIKTESFDPPLAGRASPVWGLSVLSKSPHPNAGLVFANWLMSKEFQAAYAKTGYGAVNRRDVKHLVEEKYWPAKLVTQYWVPEDKWILFEQYSYSNKAGVFKLMKEGMSKDTWLKWMKDTSTAFWGTYPPPLNTSFTWEQ